MPWLMNCGRTTEVLPLADGSSRVFPSRTRVYVPLACMTVDLGQRVRGKKFLSFGGDPPSLPRQVPAPAVIAPPAQTETKSDASSVHHQVHVMLPPSLEEVPAQAPQDHIEEEQQEPSEEVVETVAVAAVNVEAGSLPNEGQDANQGIDGYKSRRNRRRHPV